MTTAHRATFQPALGGAGQGGNILVARSTKVCARDQPALTTLKLRAAPAAPLFEPEPEPEDRSKRGFRARLERGEAAARRERLRELLGEEAPVEARAFDEEAILRDIEEGEKSLLLAITDGSGDSGGGWEGSDRGRGDRRGQAGDSGGSGSVRPNDGESQRGGRGRRADFADGGEGDSVAAAAALSASDSEDDEAQLMRELSLIHAERAREAEERARLAREEARAADRERAAWANPVVVPLADDGDSGDGGGLKRRWDEDVVFRNQAKDVKKVKKRFINDTVRSDFHRRFLARYMR